MEAQTTKYGTLKGISLYTVHANGMLQDCAFVEEIELQTTYGILIPKYAYDFRTKNHYAVSFYSDGSLRRISLNQPTEILTSLGPISAELITFYENGNIKRIFPLNGQLSAFWEESDEYQLATELAIKLNFGEINSKIIALSFYENGDLKDLTFWPNEKIKLNTPLVRINVRIGVSLYQDGSLKSLEPAFPTKINTPIGALLAYDKNANGISGDFNSLNFTKEGTLMSLITSGNSIKVVLPSGDSVIYTPSQEIDEDGIEICFHPLQLEFEEDSVTFNHMDTYPIASSKFLISTYTVTAISGCDDCESCNKECSSKAN